MDPLNKASYVTNVNVGEYVRVHYDMKEGDTILKDKDIVHHLSKKFKTNFPCYYVNNQQFIYIVHICLVFFKHVNNG